MDDEFTTVWHAIGWEDFACVSESGSCLLTIQFLCTLREVDDGISFRLFRIKYTPAWGELNQLLGFDSICKTKFRNATPGFVR